MTQRRFKFESNEPRACELQAQLSLARVDFGRWVGLGDGYVALRRFEAFQSSIANVSEPTVVTDIVYPMNYSHQPAVLAALQKRHLWLDGATHPRTLPAQLVTSTVTPLASNPSFPRSWFKSTAATFNFFKGHGVVFL